jgi:hypothetical protein
MGTGRHAKPRDSSAASIDGVESARSEQERAVTSEQRAWRVALCGWPINDSGRDGRGGHRYDRDGGRREEGAKLERRRLRPRGAHHGRALDDGATARCSRDRRAFRSTIAVGRRRATTLRSDLTVVRALVPRGGRDRRRERQREQEHYDTTHSDEPTPQTYNWQHPEPRWLPA